MLICVKCLKDMECEYNGVLVAHDRYDVRYGDLYKCPECGIEIITNFGVPVNVELAEEYYTRKAGTYRRLFRLDDGKTYKALPVEV